MDHYFVLEKKCYKQLETHALFCKRGNYSDITEVILHYICTLILISGESEHLKTVALFVYFETLQL